MKKLLALMLSLMLMLSLVPAMAEETAESAEAAETVETAEDPIVIQAGETIVRKSQLTSYVETYVDQYGWTREQLVTALAQELALEMKLSELNIVLTDTEEQTIYYQYMVYYQYMAQMMGYTDLTAIDSSTSSMIQSYVSMYFGMNYSNMRWDALLGKLQAATVGEQTVTDEEALACYQQVLAEQTASLTPSAYETALEDGTLVCYIPAGMRYVKNLLIKKDEGAGDDPAEWPEATAKADEVLALLAAGGDFDTLMAQYTEDPGMAESAYGKTGYLVYEGKSFDSAFLQAAFALEAPGDYSDKTPGSYGYYIIGFASEVEAGAIPYEQVQEAVIAKVRA